MARLLRCSGVIFGFIPSPSPLSCMARQLHSRAGPPKLWSVPAVCLPAIPSAYCHKRADSSVMSPASSLVVAFESSDRTFLSDALPRSDLLCKLLINEQKSAKAAADANGDPLVTVEPRTGSAIHDGKPPIVPSGSSQ